MSKNRAFAVLAVIVTLAGCSSSSDTAQKSGPAGPGSRVVSTQVGKPGTVAAKPIAVCQTMPAAAVAKIVGEPITTAQEVDVPNLKMYECDYNTADSSYAMSLHVMAQDAKSNFDSDVQGASARQTVPGLGDKAANTTAGLDALFGDVLIRAAVPGRTPVAVRLIKALHAAM